MRLNSKIRSSSGYDDAFLARTYACMHGAPLVGLLDLDTYEEPCMRCEESLVFKLLFSFFNSSDFTTGLIKSYK